MCILCVNNIHSQDLSVLSMSEMGFQQKVWIGGG